MFLLAATMACCTHLSVKQIDNWRWGSFGIQCPPLELRIGHAMTSKNKRELKSAVRFLEDSLRMKLFAKEKQRNKPYVIVHGETPSYLSTINPCRSRYLVQGVYGRAIRFPDFGRVQKFDVIACTSLVKRVMALTSRFGGRSNTVQHLRNLGVKGTFAHELLHPYMGDDVEFAHVKYTGTLMSDSPRILVIGDVTRGIFGRIKRACK